MAYSIGVFDSGIGGLTILKQLKRAVPNARYYYISDQSYAPYGDKKPEEVVERCEKIARELIEKYSCGIVVVACNTATTHAIRHLRGEFKNVDFVGVEPAIKPVLLDEKYQTIGVLATKNTIRSSFFRDNLTKHQGEKQVVLIEGIGLVEAIEHEDKEKLKNYLDTYIKAFKNKKIDCLVLGCTHYPILKIELEKGLNVPMIEPSIWVAKQLVVLVKKRGICIENTNSPIEHQFITTQNNVGFFKKWIEKMDVLSKKDQKTVRFVRIK